MKIGVIVYSHTGNTISVARRLQEKLLAAGHSLSLEQVTAINDEQTDAGKIQLTKDPDVSTYDVVIFGSPVRGFSLSPVMTAYLSQIASLHGKKVICFVTEFFPYPWMGGNQAIHQMKKICKLKDGKVLGTGIVNWSNLRRKKMIIDIVEKISKLI